MDGNNIIDFSWMDRDGQEDEVPVSTNDFPSDQSAVDSSLIPSEQPTLIPSHHPSSTPTQSPSMSPSTLPSFEPSSLSVFSCETTRDTSSSDTVERLVTFSYQLWIEEDQNVESILPLVEERMAESVTEITCPDDNRRRRLQSYTPLVAVRPDPPDELLGNCADIEDCHDMLGKMTVVEETSGLFSTVECAIHSALQAAIVEIAAETDGVEAIRWVEQERNPLCPNAVQRGNLQQNDNSPSTKVALGSVAGAGACLALLLLFTTRRRFSGNDIMKSMSSGSTTLSPVSGGSSPRTYNPLDEEHDLEVFRRPEFARTRPSPVYPKRKSPRRVHFATLALDPIEEDENCGLPVESSIDSWEQESVTSGTAIVQLQDEGTVKLMKLKDVGPYTGSEGSI